MRYKTMLKNELLQMKPMIYCCLFIIVIALAVFTRETVEMTYLSENEFVISTLNTMMYGGEDMTDDEDLDEIDEADSGDDVDKIDKDMNVDNFFSHQVYTVSGFSELMESLGTIFPVLALLVSLWLFRGWHKGKRRRYYNSLPFTYKEQIRIKWVTGAIVLTGLWMIFCAMMLIIRACIIDDMEEQYLYLSSYATYLFESNLLHVLVYFVYAWLAMMCVFSILALAETVVNSTLLAKIFGLIMTGVPYIFYNLAKFYLNYPSYLMGEDSYSELDQFDVSYLMWSGQLYGSEMAGAQKLIILAKLLLLLSVILFCLWGMWKEKAVDLSKKGSLIRMMPFRILLSLGMGICAGAVLSFMIFSIVFFSYNYYDISTGYYGYGYIYGLLPVTCLAASAGIYMLLRIKVRGVQV